MTDYISRAKALADFEACNAENPRWTPQRVKTLLLRQPAADVAEVVHGQWLTHYRSGVTAAAGFVSSCCDMWAERRSNYRPYCGAKMSGGEEIVRLVDLDAVIDRLEVEVGYEGMREDLYSLPVVDAVPVVRCKDCINYSGSMCFRCGQGHEVSVDADDFCSRGVTE